MEMMLKDIWKSKRKEVSKKMRIPKESPAPDSYIRYWNPSTRQTEFMRLLTRRGPLTYPRRYAEVAAEAQGPEIVFDELNPSEAKNHIYLAYPGLSKGFLWEVWHPYNIRTLSWDEDITDIDESLTRTLTYEDSPYEAPTYPIWILHDRYSMLRPRNISGETKNPAVNWLAYVYQVIPNERLTERERSSLLNGTLRSAWVDVGGEA